MRKIISRTPLPAHFNAVEWLEDQGHADTAGAARQLLSDGRLRSDSGHILGRQQVERQEKKDGKTITVKEFVAAPILPVSARKSLRVVAADA